MTTPFNFKTFCKKFKFSQDTIEVLTKERLDDAVPLSMLGVDTILGLGIVTGEQLRLEAALTETFPPAIEPTVKVEAAVSVEKLDLSSVDLHQGTGQPPHQGVQQQSAFPSGQATTESLARDDRLAALLTEFLGANENTGVRNLIALGQNRHEVRQPATDFSYNPVIQSGIPALSRGERPLLIADFLTSNLNVSYGRDTEESVQLNASTKIVIDKKAKKLEVSEYTPEIWTAASFRIVVHLLQTGASSNTLLEYADYCAMIGDFLCMYVKKGVFLLDETHRYRVAKEARKWNNICSHDERRFLKHIDTAESAKLNNQSKRGNTSSRRKRTTVDSEGKSICWNFNNRKGCELTTCSYSHVCADCHSKHPQYECQKSSSKAK